MAADALTPNVACWFAAVLFTMEYKLVLFFHEEGFELYLPYQC